ncbi:putative Nucleotidyltransferase superfamily [Helianthus debilis subsp. tardiflorus]
MVIQLQLLVILYLFTCNSTSCPVVEEFGSFSMDLFTTESDLDLSINFRNSSLLFPRDQKIKTLRKFARKFYALQSKPLPILIFAFIVSILIS